LYAFKKALRVFFFSFFLFTNSSLRLLLGKLSLFKEAIDLYFFNDFFFFFSFWSKILKLWILSIGLESTNFLCKNCRRIFIRYFGDEIWWGNKSYSQEQAFFIKIKETNKSVFGEKIKLFLCFLHLISSWI